MITNVIEYLQHSANSFPDKKAIIDEHGSITFSEFDKRARCIAAAIMKQCGGSINSPVGVYMEKSVDAVIAFMGVVYSGNYYCPLDRGMPAERLQKIMDTLKPMTVIRNAEDILPCNKACTEIEYEDTLKSGPADDMTLGYARVLDVDPLYVLFTSGSTGMPKGVVISHRSVIDYSEWLKRTFDFDAYTVFGNQAPFYFDNSILDIYSMLKNAASLVIIPERKFLIPGQVLSFLNEHRVNTIFWVPSALIGVANARALDEERLTHIEKILFCGEVMPTKQLNIWRRHYPDVLYANLYGPTEITDVCSYYIVDREFSDEEPLPIGKACENTDILILNERNELAGIDEQGELCVRGAGVALGYFADAERTDAVFVQNPLHDRYRDIIYRTGDIVKRNERDELIYIGRKDFQIKLQGHRIELGEIETAAGALAGIEQSCAVFDSQGKRIVLFCAVDNGLEEKSIYQGLKTRLPRYMMPSRIILTDRLPVNANGKIDRKELKEGLCHC